MLIVCIFILEILFAKRCDVGPFNIKSDGKDSVKLKLNLNDEIKIKNEKYKLLSIGEMLENTSNIIYVYETSPYIEKAIEKTPFNDRSDCYRCQDEYEKRDCGIYPRSKASYNKPCKEFGYAITNYFELTDGNFKYCNRYYTGFENVSNIYKLNVNNYYEDKLTFITGNNEYLYKQINVLNQTGILIENEFIINYDKSFYLLCNSTKDYYYNTIIKQRKSFKLGERKTIEIMIDVSSMKNNISSCNITSMDRECDYNETCETIIYVENYPCLLDENIMLCDENTLLVKFNQSEEKSEVLSYDSRNIHINTTEWLIGFISFVAAIILSIILIILMICCITSIIILIVALIILRFKRYKSNNEEEDQVELTEVEANLNDN